MGKRSELTHFSEFVIVSMFAIEFECAVLALKLRQSPDLN